MIEDTLSDKELEFETFENLSDEDIEELLNEPMDEEALEDLFDEPFDEFIDESMTDDSEDLSLPPEIVPEGIEEELQSMDTAVQEEILEDTLPDDIFSEDFPWKPDITSLSARFKSFSQGIELPAEIFSASIDFFNIKSGIFLTYDRSDDLFTPFSSIGMDETSLRRCKLSMETLKANKIVLNGETVLPSVPKAFLKAHLSKRLWDTIDLLTILVFSHHDDIFGLLFIFNSTITEIPGFADSASLLIRNSSEAFFKSRSTVISNLESMEIGPPLNRQDAADKIKKDLLKIADNPNIPDSAMIVFIDYSSIISSMKDFDSSIDEYVIERDIFKMYYSMLGGKGYIQRLSEHGIFLTFLTNLKVNKLIITNQLQTSLLSLFEKNKMISNPDIFVDEINLSGKDFSDKLDLFFSSVL